MDIRDILIDGISQLYEWFDDGIRELGPQELNWLPQGKTVSAGFNAWHVFRTTDNIANFVFRRQQPIWITANYFERMGLPKIDQGTGMALDEARAISIADASLLREYGAAVGESCLTYLKELDPESLGEIQLIKPLGEMPRWRVFREVVMTHGFMHLGEVNGIRGQLGLQFSI